MWSLLRKDLGEFVNTIKDDTAGTIKSAIAMAEEVKFSPLEGWGEEQEGCGERRVESAGSTPSGKPSAALLALRADVKTYTEDIPDGEEGEHRLFLQDFDLRAKTSEISSLLQGDAVITRIHTELVPEKVSYDAFWTRYFYRAARLDKPRAPAMSFPDEEEDDDFGWGEDEHDEGVDPSRAVGGGGGKGCERRSEEKGVGGSHFEGREGVVGITMERQAISNEAAGEVTNGDNTGVATFAKADATCVQLRAALRVSELSREATETELKQLQEELRLQAELKAPQAGESEGSGGHCGREERASKVEETLRAQLVDTTSELVKLKMEMDTAVVSGLQGEAVEEVDVEDACVATGEQSAVHKEVRAACVAAAEREAESKVALTVAEAQGRGAAAEVTRLQKLLSEERTKQIAIIRASREAAKEAVEAALNLAEVEREEESRANNAKINAEVEERIAALNAEHCREILEVEMKAREAMEATDAKVLVERKSLLENHQAEKKALIDAVNTEVAAKLKAMAEVTQLRDDLEEERIAAAVAVDSLAAAEVEMEGLRAKIEELHGARDGLDVVQAAASGSAQQAVVGEREGVAMDGLTRRSTIPGTGSEDTDGWGEDEEDGDRSSGNSSGVVVEHPRVPPVNSSPHSPANTAHVDGNAQAPSGLSEDVVHAASPSPMVSTGRRTGRDGEGDEEWSGWD